MKQKKFLLTESEIPVRWCNILADMPVRPQTMLDPQAYYCKQEGVTNVTPSPSMSTRAGKDILTRTPNHQGSLGTAISEAVDLHV